MDTITNAGALLRIYRLRKNRSLETLCQGICTASYLSKIEQGKVKPNRALLEDLFSKMGVSWQKITPEEGRELCDRLYELVFSDDEEGIRKCQDNRFWNQEPAAVGACFLDYIVLNAYCKKKPEILPKQMLPLLDERQASLIFLTEGNTEEAVRSNPCALTYQFAGAQSYSEGKYTRALELLVRAYDLAASTDTPGS